MNAKYHYQEVHEKNHDRKMDTEFFQRNKGLILDRETTDPNYPTNEKVLEMINDSRAGVVKMEEAG